MKTICITGAAGFISGHVIEEAHKRGYKVISNIRREDFETRPEHLKDVELYTVDGRDKVGMRAMLEKVDGVINLQGILGTKHVDNPREFYENNVFSALNVYDACLEFKIPVVQIGVGNYFEHNNYSNSKVAAERDLLMYAKFRGLKGNVVRGLNVIGERQKVKNTGKIAPTFITKALKGEDIQVYGGKNNCSIMDIIYVKDIANILLDVLEDISEGIVMTGTVVEAGQGIGYSVYEIAEMIIALTKSKSKIIEVPMREGESERSQVVAKNPYPYKYTPLEVALTKTIDYYKNNLNA